MKKKPPFGGLVVFSHDQAAPIYRVVETAGTAHSVGIVEARAREGSEEFRILWADIAFLFEPSRAQLIAFIDEADDGSATALAETAHYLKAMLDT